jgi:hypothetical protein
MAAVRNFSLALGFMTIYNEPLGLDTWNTVQLLYKHIEKQIKYIFVLYVACRAVESEMGPYTIAVSGQRLYKHVPAQTDTNKNRGAVFSMWPVPRCYKQGIRLELSHFRTGVC